MRLFTSSATKRVGILMLCAGLSGCFAKGKWEENPIAWIDQAQLHDDRVIEVHRKVSPTTRIYFLYFVWVADRELNVDSIEATNPDTGKPVEWTGEQGIRPLMLDFVDRVPYLVISGQVYSYPKYYGCPELPFVFLKYDESKSDWIPINWELAPEMLGRANLYNGYYRQSNNGLISKEEIAADYAAQRQETKMYTRNFPKDYSSWGYRYKDSLKGQFFVDDCRRESR